MLPEEAVVVKMSVSLSLPVLSPPFHPTKNHSPQMWRELPYTRRIKDINRVMVFSNLASA